MIVYILQETRVNNFSPNSMDNIMELWESAYDSYEDFADYIKYAIYHNYESNYRGDYTLSLATKDIETGYEFNLKMDKYIKYSAEDMDDLPNLWEEIWDDEENCKIDRTYKYDYERYNLDDSVDVFIGIK